jgi:hypothetical protein
MDKAHIVLECVVGSQLHGTATPESDTDIRRVVASPLLIMLSPFRPPAFTPAQEPRVDMEVHELQRFVKLLSQSNLTAIEMLWSDLIMREHPHMHEMRDRRQIFLESKRIYEAARGYSLSQRGHVERLMSGDPDEREMRRAGKFAAAYARVLSQATVLLAEGDFDPHDVGSYRAEIMSWKNNGISAQEYEVFKEIGDLLSASLTDTYIRTEGRFMLDTSEIERFNRDIYLSVDDACLLR